MSRSPRLTAALRTRSRARAHKLERKLLAAYEPTSHSHRCNRGPRHESRPTQRPRASYGGQAFMVHGASLRRGQTD
jgi:hypothetical protein